MNKIDQARAVLLPEVKPVSESDWVRYHIVSMIHLKSDESPDEAIRRLSLGAHSAPWREVKRRFMTSLAVALIKKQQYKNALEVLQEDINLLDVVEKQKRFALVGHSHAAIGERKEAIENLDHIADAGDPNVRGLRGFLFERYSLYEVPKKAPSNLSLLDFQIAQKELFIAMAA